MTLQSEASDFTAMAEAVMDAIQDLRRKQRGTSHEARLIRAEKYLRDQAAFRRRVAGSGGLARQREMTA